MALITIDTNIVIHALAGNKRAVQSVNGNECIVSFMVAIELLSWKEIASQENLITEFLGNCIIKDNDKAIQESVIEIRKCYGLKIPDAFIAATALQLGLPLFSGDPVFQRIPDLNFIYVEF